MKLKDFKNNPMLNKDVIDKAISYANLSQWIQTEVWDYRDNIVIQKDATELADRIIKRVLADKNTVNNAKHKEGFDAGYKKGYKKGMEDHADYVFGDTTLEGLTSWRNEIDQRINLLK